MTKCRESRTRLEEHVETLRKTHTELLHNRDKCALDIKVCCCLLSATSLFRCFIIKDGNRSPVNGNRFSFQNESLSSHLLEFHLG